MDINILKEKDFIPSTITIAGKFNLTINMYSLAEYMPIVNIFDENGERRKLISGSRESIKYFGPEGAIVSICYSYKKIRRGMRTGAMNNMISVDMQYGMKNIHLKISSTSITSVGTHTLECGKKVSSIMIEHIKNLKKNINIINNIDNEKKISDIEWLSQFLSKYDKIPREIILKKAIEESDIGDKIFLKFCTLYINDFDDKELYLKKLNDFLEDINLYEGDLNCDNFTVYNSVYHLNPISNKLFRMPLHRLAPFLANMGVAIEYHNWTSEGVNICFDIEERKSGINHTNKEYKHRFTIHETTKIRQCSPSSKKEAYKNYLGVMNLLKLFFSSEDVDYRKYIKENFSNSQDLEKLTSLLKK